MASRFEYARIFSTREPETTVRLPGGSDQTYPDVLTALNQLGSEGRELIAGTDPSNLISILYLKREVVDGNS